MVLAWLSAISQYRRRILSAIEWKKFILAFCPFLCYLLVFKFSSEIRHFTRLEQFRPPDYVTLPQVEKALFFCFPHRIISGLANPFLDVLAGIPYMVHYPLPFLFGFYLAISPARRAALYPYMWNVGWVDLCAILFQIVFPSAPPWYSDHTVFDFDGNVVYEVTGEAEFYRLDYLLHYPFYRTIYSQSPFKWGAFPSLHVALPAIVMVNHPWGGLKFGIIHVVWISFAAMYATEHYLIDIIAAVMLVLVVRYSILRIWSPFPELDNNDEDKGQQSNDYHGTLLQV